MSTSVNVAQEARGTDAGYVGADAAGAGAVGADAVGAGSAQARVHLKAALRYVLAALGCLVFAFVYAQFSHGVYSPFMSFMFAIPLVGGAFAALVLHFRHARPVPLPVRQAWALTLATLTVASCLRGIFEIAGTSSAWLWAYLAIAAAFAIATLVASLRARSLSARSASGPHAAL